MKDEFSPIKHTLALAAKCGAPAPIVVYQGARHALSGASSVVSGPRFRTLMADWLCGERVNGRPAEEYLEYVMSDGRIERRPHPRQAGRAP